MTDEQKDAIANVAQLLRDLASSIEGQAAEVTLDNPTLSAKEAEAYVLMMVLGSIEYAKNDLLLTMHELRIAEAIRERRARAAERTGSVLG